MNAGNIADRLAFFVRRHAGHILLFIGVALMPLIALPSVPDATLNIRWLWIVVIGTVAAMRALLGTSEDVRLPAIPLTALITLLAISILSCVNATVISEGIYECIRVLSFLILCVVVSLLLKKTDGMLFLSAGFVVACVILEVVGGRQLIEALRSNRMELSLYEVTGLMGHRNLFAGALLFCLPFHAHLLSKLRSPFRLLLAVNVLVVIAMVILLQSRTAWLALGGGALVYAGIQAYSVAKMPKQQMKKVMLRFATVVMVLLAALIFMFQSNVFGDDLMASLKSRFRSLHTFRTEQNINTMTITERFKIWNNTTRLISEGTFTGVGAGQWKFQFAKYGLQNTRAEQGEIVFQRPHNDYLWYFSETGIIGLLAFTGLLLFGFVRAVQSLQRRYHNSSLVAAASAGLVMYSITSFFDFPRERAFHSFFLAVVLGVLSVAHRNELMFSIRRKSLMLLLLIAGVTTSAYLALRLKSEWHFSNAMNHRFVGDGIRMTEELNAARSVLLFQTDPTATALQWYLGEYEATRGRYDDALHLYRQAERLTPYHLHTLNNLGAVSFLTNDHESALRYWERALDISPTFRDANLNVAAMYYEKGDMQRAVFQFLEADPDITNDRYRHFSRVIIGNHIQEMADTIEHAGLRSKILDVVSDVLWIAGIRGRSRSNGEAFESRVIKECLYALRTDGVISAREADSLLTEHGIEGW